MSATALVFALLVSLTTMITSTALINEAGAQPHDAVVPSVTRTDTPEILDGTVWDSEQWGNLIIVGGQFTQVKDNDGTIYDQANVMAYDINTGDLITSFNPVINGLVREVEVAEDGQSVYVGGKFTQVDGLTRKRLAKLDNTGELITAFNANVAAEVNGLAVANGKVYVGGSFLKLENTPRGKFGAVDAVTGDLDTGLDLPLTGGIGKNQQYTVKALDITPDGNTLLVVHTATYIDGLERAGVAMVDISGPTASVLPWQTDLYHDWYWRCSGGFLALRDGEISPDGSYFVVVGKGHDRPPVCDTAIRWPIAGAAGVQPTWISRHFDSIFSVGISDHAVYTGGHFRYQEAPGSPNPYPGDQMTTYNVGLPETVAALGDSIVPRDQIGALDPLTGKSLDWAPNTNSFVCVCALTVIDRGLLVGHDNSQVVFQTGRHAFFDFGGPVDETDPTISITSPAPDENIGLPATLTGTATDNVGVDEVYMSLKSRNGLGWYRVDGTFGSWEKHPISMSNPGDFTTDWSTSLDLPDGPYTAYFWSVDAAGNKSLPKPKVRFAVSSVIDTAPPTVTISTPTPDQIVEPTVNFTGVALDDQSVAQLMITVQNRTTKEWLQPDFTWATGWKALDIPLAATGPSVAFDFSALLPDGDYTANFFAIDTAGKKTPQPRPSVKFTVN